jgi:hypothetical protein
MSLRFEDCLDHIAVNVSAFDAAIAAAAPDGRVPSCPDWSTPELRSHVAEVLAFWHGQLGPEAVATEPHIIDHPLSDAPILEMVAGDVRWLIALSAQGVRRDTRAPDASVSGSPSQVQLALWGRSSGAQWSGPASIRDAWTKLATIE